MYNQAVYTQGAIPKAPFYVTSTDRFMSGWGASRGKNNRLIFPCSTLAEAERVEAYALRRSDQMNVRIASRKPRLNLTANLYQLMLKADCGAWYGGAA